MATRIEKIYKTNSLKLLNDILQEISNNIKPESKYTKTQFAELCKTISNKICVFIDKNNITDKDLREAVNGK